MTRKSDNTYRDGRLWVGYDYDKQSWVVDGVYIDCGHPWHLLCDCYGRLHQGEATLPRPDRKEGDW
jgi:hypothetical protein